MSRHEEVYVQDCRVGRAAFARVSFAPGDLIGAISGDVIEDSVIAPKFVTAFSAFLAVLSACMS